MEKSIGVKTCRQHHVLGQMRVTASGQEVFELYRQAIDYESENPDPVDVIAVIIGRAREIRCSICDGLIEWNEARPRPSRKGAFE